VTEFQPIGARLVALGMCFGLCALAVDVVASVTSAVIAFAVMAPLLSIVGVIRSFRVSFVVDDRGIRFRN
jgi:hypothetical protein